MLKKKVKNKTADGNAAREINLGKVLKQSRYLHSAKFLYLSDIIAE